MINVEIQGADNTGRVLRTTMIKRNGEQGPVVFTEALRQFDSVLQPAFNPMFGIEMARDFSFGGTPVGIHDGIDSTLWTASAIVGAKYTFDSTDQANSGTKSIKTDKANVGHVMELDRGSDLDLSAYVAITLFVYVDNGWSPGSSDSVEIYGWDTGTSMQIGDAVMLEDFFNETVFGTWHKVTIPLTNMSLESATIDALRVEIVSKSGSGPLFYIDDMQVEQTGDSATFKVEAPAGKLFLVENISFSFVDALDTALLNNSMYNLSYDKILGEAALATGIVFQRSRKGVILFSASIKTIGDSIKFGATLKNVISDGTNTCITLETVFGEPLMIDPRSKDSISIILSDDLSGLISFTSIAKGKTRNI